MPKLLYSGPSPYSAKARMAAALAGYAVEAVSVDTNAEPDLLIDNNPLGKIPVLLTDDGRAVFDSAMILQFINREKRNSIFPANAAKRTDAEVTEALADGLMDALLAHAASRHPEPSHGLRRRPKAAGPCCICAAAAASVPPPRVGAADGSRFSLCRCLVSRYGSFLPSFRVGPLDRTRARLAAVGCS